MFIIYTTISS